MDMSSGGVAFALSHATLEGKITIAVLLVFSLVSWTIIINKFRQLGKAKKRNATFLGLYSKTKTPLVMNSRSDSALTRIYTMALAAVLAGAAE